MSGTDARRRGVAATGCLAVAAAIAALHVLGSGPLAAPDVGSVGELQAWVGDRDALTVGMVAIRLLGLGLGYHLIATTTLAVVGRLLRRPGLVRFAEVSTLAPLRGTVRRLAGLGLSATAVLATPLPPATADPGGSAILTFVAPAPDRPRPADPERVGPPEQVEPGEPVVLERIDRDPTTVAGTATLRVEATPAGMVPPGQATLRVETGDEPAEPAPVPPDRHRVRPGDHLWSIAEARLATHLGRAPSEVEVGPYWRTVVAANPQLVDADLLFPGDDVIVPPPPGGGRAAMHRHP